MAYGRLLSDAFLSVNKVETAIPIHLYYTFKWLLLPNNRDENV